MLGLLGGFILVGEGDGSKLFCMIWKNVFELALPERNFMAASRFANSLSAAG